MQRHPDYTRERVRQLGGRIRDLVYARKLPVSALRVSPRTGRISYAEAQKLKYKPVKLGAQLGPLWATFWFKGQAAVPKEWAGQRVDLLWNSHSEATLWVDGRSVQGLNYEPHGGADSGARPDAVLLKKARGGETLSFDVEIACNRMFGAGPGPYASVSPYVLDQCDIAIFDAEAWEVYYDFLVLQELEADSEKGLDKTWAGTLLYELNRFANVFDIEDRATWPEARKILKPLYAQKNPALTHELSAIGHAHIDTAWLWPLDETRRKCERTFSSQVAYMDAYPEYKFACSQACQYEWMKRTNPDLYARMKAKVKSGQFVPVGGTWVEPDCNIPSGEALARQFLYGQRFFQQEFGITCREFWNPDVFGYNGQLPQLMRLSGITRFLTQKLSWNRFNKPAYHTFTWQGIDGSEVLAHFPPLDTYNALATVAQLRENVRNYKDHDRSRHSLMLFGFGDGGGGPTKRMIETLRRCRNLLGVPRTQTRTSADFFARLEKDCTDRPLMIGELYFEYHRGTYTTQASTKRNNRKNEFLLHDLEFLAACAHKLAQAPYPRAELEQAWRLLLTNQFHDILPGSSITLVYQDTEKQHAEVRKLCEPLRAAAARALAPQESRGGEWTPVNTTGFARREVAELPNGRLVFVDAPSYGVGAVVPAPDLVSVKKRGQEIVLENQHIKAVLSTGGDLLSLVEKESGRESLTGPANVLELYDDRPTNYDAWDVDPYHVETRQPCPPAHACEVHAGPLRASVVFEREIGRKSGVTQTVRLDAGARRLEFHTDADWHEDCKMLKVAFPVNARAMNATYEMQFGCVERPTHYNTSYDLARYEVPGHKWADLSEPGFGVALLTDCKYGYSSFGDTLRISLLRSPKSPDPVADMGKHSFAYAVLPHAGGWREGGVVSEAIRFNVPVVLVPGHARPQALLSVDQPNLVLDTVKLAEDSDAVVLRFYEAHGARGVARAMCALPFKKAVFCNILEEDGAAVAVRNGRLEIPYTPFQVVSVKLV